MEIELQVSWTERYSYIAIYAYGFAFLLDILFWHLFKSFSEYLAITQDM